MTERKLASEYRKFGFVKSQLEDVLGFSLGGERSLPDYLKPYKTRIGIQLDEAANIFAGCRPSEHINSGPLVDIIRGYRASLWDAYDNDILSGNNIIMDYNYNEEYRVDVTLVKDQVTKWAREHNLDWPFELPESEIDNESSSVDLLSKIESLELENKSLKTKINELSAQEKLIAN